MDDWLQRFAEVDEGLREWRREHPRASLTEIEQALDARWLKLRAQMVTDLAQASPAADFGGAGAERPLCPTCAVPLQARGKHRRTLRTQGEHALPLERDYGVCPRCGEAFCPSG